MADHDALLARADRRLKLTRYSEWAMTDDERLIRDLARALRVAGSATPDQEDVGEHQPVGSGPSGVWCAVCRLPWPCEAVAGSATPTPPDMDVIRETYNAGYERGRTEAEAGSATPDEGDDDG
jgi:hypothetical protein